MYVVGTPPCTLCEKIIVTIQTTTPITSTLELPNTFDPVAKDFAWKRDNNMSYLLVPQVAIETTGVVDVFLCIDEDILDDIDVRGYTTKFLEMEIFPLWKNIKSVTFSEPIQSTPDGVACWKRH